MGSKPTKKKADKDIKEIKKEKIKKVIEGVSGIVRIIDRDVDGHKKVRHALLQVKGISHNIANAVTVLAGIDPNVMIGSLKEDEIGRIEKIIEELPKNVPSHILNRRKEIITGENKHVISSDLMLTKKDDIDLMKKMQCYKGVRHQMGLPVRGQRTRSSFRTGGMLGVIKKKQLPGAAAPAEAKKEEKK